MDRHPSCRVVRSLRTVGRARDRRCLRPREGVTDPADGGDPGLLLLVLPLGVGRRGGHEM